MATGGSRSDGLADTEHDVTHTPSQSEHSDRAGRLPCRARSAPGFFFKIQRITGKLLRHSSHHSLSAPGDIRRPGFPESFAPAPAILAQQQTARASPPPAQPGPGGSRAKPSRCLEQVLGLGVGEVGPVHILPPPPPPPHQRRPSRSPAGP